MASPVDLDDVVPRQDELDTVASNDVRTVLENIFVRNEEGELIGIPSIEEVCICVNVCTCVVLVAIVHACRSSSFDISYNNLHITRMK